MIRPPAAVTIARDTASLNSGAASFRVDLGNTAPDWYAQLLQPNVPLASRTHYTLTFAARATSARSIRAALHQNSGAYASYYDHNVAIGTTWQTYTLHFTAGTTDSAALFALNLGGAPGSVWIDDVALTAG